MLTITTLCPSFNSLFQTNFPLVGMAGKSLWSGVVLTSANQPLLSTGADIQLAIVGDRLISLDVRRIVLGAQLASSSGERLRAARPGPIPILGPLRHQQNGPPASQQWRRIN